MRTFAAALLSAALLPTVVAAQAAPQPPTSVDPAPPPAAPAEASAAEPRKNIVWQNMLAARFNPLGLFNETRLGYRDWLYERSEERVLKGCYLGASAVLFTSPALFQAGADVEYSPLAILQLHAGYRLVGYFGTFGMQQSYGSPDANWSDQQRRDASDLAQASLGNMFTGGGLLQLRFGDLVVPSNLRFFWQDQDLDGDPPVFYDPVIDVLQPNGGLSIVNDADLMWLADERWTLGVRHNFSRAFYEEDTPFSDESAFQQRVGPLIGYRLKPDPEKSAPAPMLFLLVQAHLTHRFRTGGLDGDPAAADAVSQAVPYVGIAYRIAGDL